MNQGNSDDETDSDYTLYGMLKGWWYQGVITRYHGDGRYDIVYDNNVMEERVPFDCITPYLWNVKIKF